jgi:hypothetical protein
VYLIEVEVAPKMSTSDSVAGLIKWLSKEPWRDAFLEVLEHHTGLILEEQDISSFDELGGLIGVDWATTVWVSAFEDLLTREVEGAGYMVDDYLKRRGWNESAPNKAYMAGLKNSVMSLYEVSDIQPGRSFIARDLINGGKPVRVHERTATETLRKWDRIAARIVDVRGKKILSGGLLPFERDLSEQFLASISEGEARKSSNISSIKNESGRGKHVSASDSLIDTSANQSDFSLNLAPQLSLYFLNDLIERIVDPVVPQIANSDGEDIELMRLVYRLAKGVTAKEARAALNQIPELETESKTFWNWLEQKGTQRKKRNPDQSYGMEFGTSTTDGLIILGTIELKPKTIELCVNSESRADRGHKILESSLAHLVGPPLVGRQTLKQALSEDRDDGSSSEVEELPPEEIHMVIHEAMNQHYRAQLDQAVPMLGNISPRKAAKSKAGREKLVTWLKGLENMNARHDDDDPMSSYDTTWMWEELGISNLRK